MRGAPLPLSLLVALALAGPGDGANDARAPASATPAPEAATRTADEATAAADAWFTQLHGFDALEAYESRTGSRRVEFVVARRWKSGRAELVIDIRSPPGLEKLAFLFLQNRDRSDDFFVYWPPWRKVLRATAAELSGGLLPTGLFVTLGDLRPILPGELVHVRRPDEEVEGEPCFAVESRPSGRPLGFDRMLLSISRRSGVALRTRLYRGERELRRILVSPRDIGSFDDRHLPTRRRVELADGSTAELFLRNLMIDPPLPDQLFSKQSLQTQRFPSF
jgi:hypothetical protein